MEKFFAELHKEFDHVEGDVNDKVQAWLSEFTSKVNTFRRFAVDLPHRAQVGLEIVVDSLSRASEDIGRHSSKVDGTGDRPVPANDK